MSSWRAKARPVRKGTLTAGDARLKGDRKGISSGGSADRARAGKRLQVTATGQELSALVGAARMALDAMRSAPEPPPGGVLDAVERVLTDFDRARERVDEVPRGGG